MNAIEKLITLQGGRCIRSKRDGQKLTIVKIVNRYGAVPMLLNRHFQVVTPASCFALGSDWEEEFDEDGPRNS